MLEIQPVRHVRFRTDVVHVDAGRQHHVAPHGLPVVAGQGFHRAGRVRSVRDRVLLLRHEHSGAQKPTPGRRRGPVQILGHLQGRLLLLAMRANAQLFDGASQESDCGCRILQPDLDDLFGLRENHGQEGGTPPDGASRGTSPPGMEWLQAVGFKIVTRIDFRQS
uniref:(northern house mosquito) hypothetical protein n=1 Tax=Culex pipiens TaxID=7175 RepID=A0A8D8L5A7_CULPI